MWGSLLSDHWAVGTSRACFTWPNSLSQCSFATFPTCRHTFQPSPIQIKPFICEIPHFLELLLLWSSRITTGINRVLRCLSQVDHGTSCPSLQLMTTRNINCLHLYLDTSEVTQLPKCRAPDSLFALAGLLTQLKHTAAHQFESLVPLAMFLQLQFLQDPTKHRKDFNAQAAVKLTFIKHRNAEFHYSWRTFTAAPQETKRCCKNAVFKK